MSLSNNPLFEAFVLIGNSKQKKYGFNFTEISISAANEMSANNNYNSTYNFAISKGIKLPNNLTINNYTKYTSRTNCHPIYKKTIYEQLSVAKTIYFSNNDARASFTAQIGYFWDQSLKINHYQTSGVVLSLWTET